MPRNQKYTVQLRRPDYVTTDPDDSMFLDRVYAPSAKLAADAARRNAWVADGNEEGPEELLKDYAVVFLCKGHVMNLSFRVNK